MTTRNSNAATAVKDALAAASKRVMCAIGAGLLISAASTATAGTVTFDYFNIYSSTAVGTLTLTSSLLLAQPFDPNETYLFDLTPAAIAAAGETVLGDLSSFYLSAGGHTLTKADITSIPTGWTDEPTGVLGNTWTASHTFTSPSPGITLFLNNGPEGSAVTLGSKTTGGFWLIRPVPLPDPAWLLLSGIGLCAAFITRRQFLATAWIRAFESRRPRVGQTDSSPGLGAFSDQHPVD